MSGVDTCAITDRGEVADSDGIELGTDRHIVPNGGPFADYDLTEEGGVGGNPSVVSLGDAIVEGHRLSVARRLLQVSNIVCHRATHAVQF